MNSARPRGPRLWVLLPGFEADPVGGYRVVYEYASYLAGGAYDVTIVHSRSLLRVAGGISPPSLALRSFKSAAQGWTSRRHNRPIPWFRFDSKVRVRFTIGLPDLPAAPGDFLIATAAQTAPFVADIATRSGACGIYFIQSFESWSMPTDFVEATWRLPLHRVVVAPWLVQVGKSLGVEVDLVPNAVSATDFEPGPALHLRHPIVMALVSSTAVKRTDLVASVFTSLHRQNPAIGLITFGTGDRPSGVPDSTVHLKSPSRSALAAAYRSARVYLCASDVEGWGLPPAEALLSGTAVVSTENGGVRSYASDAALFAAVGDAEGLTDAVRTLLADTAQAQRLTDQGRSALVAYTPKHAAERFASQLQKAAAQRSRDGSVGSVHPPLND